MATYPSRGLCEHRLDRLVAQVHIDIVRVAVEQLTEVLERGHLDEPRAVLAQAIEQSHNVLLLDLLVRKLRQCWQNLHASLANTPDLVVRELLEHGEDDADEEIVTDNPADTGQTRHQLSPHLDAAVVLHRDELGHHTLAQHSLPEGLT